MGAEGVGAREEEGREHGAVNAKAVCIWDPLTRRPYILIYAIKRILKVSPRAELSFRSCSSREETWGSWVGETCREEALPVPEAPACLPVCPPGCHLAAQKSAHWSALQLVR